MATRKKHNATVGVFESKARAEQAIDDLKAAGFDESKIGLVYKNESGETVTDGAGGDTYAEEGAVAGAAVGAGAMALGSLAVSLGVIPVIGPILAVGPLAAALISAGAGAAAGGLTGALVGWGIPEDDAEYYQNEVQNGRFLVTVEANGRALEARDILHRRSGFDRSAWSAVRADRANILTEGRFNTEDGRVIELHKEELRATKEKVETGRVKVRKEVHTEEKQITVPVEHEEVVIERRPASGKAAHADMKAEEIRIPVKEERVHVTKEPVVTEEVTVGKRKVRDTKTVSGTVRKEEAVIESEGDTTIHETSKPGKK